MAENRLFQMLYLLLEKGSATAPQLAEYFEVSVRTIYRDIDILSSVGIPIYTIQGKGGGIFIQENYVLNKSLISEQEQNHIMLALQGLSLIDEESSNALLSKLGGIFQKQNINWIEIDFSEWTKKSQDIFRVLQSAIFQNKVVDFLYHSGKGQSIGRSTEPLKLVFKSREWYLYAYCRLRQDYRLFKLSRMKELNVEEEHFNRTAPERVFENLKLYSEKVVELSLVFDKKMAYRIYENFDDITENKDGSYLVKIALPNNESLYSFLLSFGDSVKVIAPMEVQENMRQRITRMNKRYET